MPAAPDHSRAAPRRAGGDHLRLLLRRSGPRHRRTPAGAGAAAGRTAAGPGHGQGPYAAHQATFDATVPHGLHYYWRSHYLEQLGDEAIDTLVDHAWSHRSPWSYTILFSSAGPWAAYPTRATAFSGRGAGYALNINLPWPRTRTATGAGRLDPADVGGHAAAWQRRLRQLPRPGGQRPGPRRLQPGQVPPAGRAEACVGSGQPVPPSTRTSPRTTYDH